MTTGTKGRSLEWGLIATLFAALFLASVDNQFLIPLLPLLSVDLGVSIEQLGGLFSLYALSAAIFNLGVGPLADRFGRLPLLRVGLLLFLFVSFGSYASRSLEELRLLRALAGVAAGILSTCTATLVGDLFPYHRRGRVMGLVLSSYFVALILGIPAGAWIAEAVGWRSVFLVSGAIALLVGIRSLFFPKVASEHRPVPAARMFRVYPRFLKEGPTLAALLVSAVTSAATLAVLTFISGYLNSEFQLRPIEISWLFLVSGIGALAGSNWAGWLSDRLGKKGVFLASNTLLVIPLLTLTRIPWGIGLGLVFLVISLLVAARQTALQTIQTELVETASRGSFLGLRNSASQLGISGGIFVAGRLFSEFGYSAVTAFSALLTVTGSILCFLMVREPTPPDQKR